MKVVFFGNGELACRVLELLIAADKVVAIVTHPEDRAKERDKLVALAQGIGAVVVEADSLRTPESLSTIKELGAEIGVSTMFGYILRQELLDLFPRGCINLHPSYLPFNRGAHPNVWPIVDGSPAGVTLHQIDAGVDTGPILAQRKVAVLQSDTARTLYDRLIDEAFDLFKDAWPAVRLGELKSIPQEGTGSGHRVNDLAELDQIELDAPTTARKLLTQLRARTFHPYPGCHFIAEDGSRIFVRVELTPDE